MRLPGTGSPYWGRQTCMRGGRRGGGDMEGTGALAWSRAAVWYVCGIVRVRARARVRACVRLFGWEWGMVRVRFSPTASLGPSRRTRLAGRPARCYPGPAAARDDTDEAWAPVSGRARGRRTRRTLHDWRCRPGPAGQRAGIAGIPGAITPAAAAARRATSRATPYHAHHASTLFPPSLPRSLPRSLPPSLPRSYCPLTPLTFLRPYQGCVCTCTRLIPNHPPSLPAPAPPHAHHGPLRLVAAAAAAEGARRPLVSVLPRRAACRRCVSTGGPVDQVARRSGAAAGRPGDSVARRRLVDQVTGHSVSTGGRVAAALAQHPDAHVRGKQSAPLRAA
jgi:hypothetical protein